MENHFSGVLDYIISYVGFVSVTRPADFTYSFISGKGTYSIIIVMNGEMSYYFPKDKKTCVFSEGEALFIPRNSPYTATYIKNDTTAYIFNFDMISENLPSLFTSIIHKKNSNFTNICKSLAPKGLNSTSFLTGKLYELISIFEQISIEPPRKYIKISQIISEVETSYFENHKISYYAELCNMSEQNFRKLFKEYTGFSFIEYRNRLRIAKAKEMIKSAEFKINEIAYFVGFNNLAFFYELYKRFQDDTNL